MIKIVTILHRHNCSHNHHHSFLDDCEQVTRDNAASGSFDHNLKEVGTGWVHWVPYLLWYPTGYWIPSNALQCDVGTLRQVIIVAFVRLFVE